MSERKDACRPYLEEGRFIDLDFSFHTKGFLLQLYLGSAMVLQFVDTIAKVC